MRLSIRLLAVGFLGLLVFSCKGAESNPQQSKSNNSKQNQDDAIKPGTDTDTAVADGNDCYDLAGRSTLALTADYTYDADIKDILEDYCVSCHASGSSDGDLSSYDGLAQLKHDIAERVASGNMPPPSSTPLPASAKSKIADWIAAGAPQTATDLAASSGSAASSDCNEDNNEDENEDEVDQAESDGGLEDIDDLSSWDEILASDAVRACKDEGKIYDRTAKACHQAEIASSYSCTESGVTGAFSAIGIDASSAITSMKTDGYSLDQCGEVGSNPIVFFIKKTEDDDTIGLNIRKLCKKGSAGCD